MDQLLSCPFCGGDDLEYFNGWKWGDREKDNSICCSPTITCQCGGFSVGDFGRGYSDKDIKRITIEAWNKRRTYKTEITCRICKKKSEATMASQRKDNWNPDKEVN